MVADLAIACPPSRNVSQISAGLANGWISLEVSGEMRLLQISFFFQTRQARNNFSFGFVFASPDASLDGF